MSSSIVMIVVFYYYSCKYWALDTIVIVDKEALMKLSLINTSRIYCVASVLYVWQ